MLPPSRDHHYLAPTTVTPTTAIVPTFSLPPEAQQLQSPSSATLEDVLASLLGLPAESHRSSVSSNHTLQIEQVQIRRRSEGDAGKRRNEPSSAGSGAVSSSGTTSGKDAAHSRRVSLDSCETTHKSHGGELLKCRYPKCDATATIAEAKKSYKSCHNCSHLYCSRDCRRAHWEKHRKACLHSRISALCRLVLSTCKDDADTLRHLSVLARRGYLSQGRGVVRILFRSPENADSFIKQGFQCLGEVAYVRWPDLLPSEMGPELYSELLKLSTEYKPDSKMLIYVAICVVSEAPGNATAPVKWERQLVSRCAKLKLCRSVINEINNSPIDRQIPKKDNATDVLILSFNIMSKTTQKSREQVSFNIQHVLRQRGVVLRKHYPEVFLRLSTFVEGTTDRFLPVTMHPRDSVTGRTFVCILMPNYGDSDRLQFPISENSDDERVVTMDVGSELGFSGDPMDASGAAQ
ncbi:apical junction component 1 homolog [Sabethes cyaneus]|uniref:apical junction component 1 homolog n=1 Tax=Sabethes cyaneus TaxID=53552 RepID=UPI00237DFA23|nr:apical junction component 1 homolog [Sabethes cyaneus]